MRKMKKNILFVDDEVQILKSLQRVFYNSPHDVIFVSSAKEALEYLHSHHVEIVVSDIRMPVMDGIELLTTVKNEYPDVMRVTLSGYTESVKINQALEENVAMMYIFKPWNNDELVDIINQLLELQEMLSRKDILNLINTMSDIPTVPSIYHEIRQLIQAQVGVEKIAKIIDKDPAISTNLLRIANSAFYGGKTGSVHQAVMYIGLQNVKNIVLSNSVFKNVGSFDSHLQFIWENSVRTNRLTTYLYQEIFGEKITNLYASAGLLHDIGKFIMYSHYKAEYQSLLVPVPKNHLEIIKHEKKCFGVTHQELGGYLLNWWGIPIPIVEVALYHHTPNDIHIIHRDLVRIVYLANYFSRDSLGKTPEYTLDLEVLDALSTDEVEIRNKVNQIQWEA